MIMVKYIVKRLLMVIPVVLGVMVIVFFFQSVSNDDPALQALGSGSTMEDREEWREEHGLNDPILIQFGRYVFNFVTKGDLGNSYESNQPVTGELLTRFPVTIRLALAAVGVGILLGIPLGVWSAVKQYTALDSVIVTGSVVMESIPNFWFALMLISLFSVRMQWLPLIYNGSIGSWIMPIIVVACMSVSQIIRVTRSSMLETIRQDYVRTARAKGQTEFNIVVHHVLRNSLIPILTAVGNHWDAVGRRTDRGDYLWNAGHWKICRRCHLRPELSGGTGKRCNFGNHLYDCQLDRRPDLCIGRSKGKNFPDYRAEHKEA